AQLWSTLTTTRLVLRLLRPQLAVLLRPLFTEQHHAAKNGRQKTQVASNRLARATTGKKPTKASLSVQRQGRTARRSHCLAGGSGPAECQRRQVKSLRI